MSGAVLVGIDIGSSAVKAGAFDLHGEPLAISRVPCVSSGETDPGEWWSAAATALQELRPGNVAAIGVCGRGGTAVLLGEGDAVLAPSWSDRRAHAEHRELLEQYPQLSRPAANLLSRALWWERHHGAVARAITAKDFVVWKLTGRLSADVASGGAPPGGLPPLVPASDPWSVAGAVNDAAAAATGLPDGIPVAVGWHDGAAAAFGAGAAVPGTAAITLGTNAVYRVVTGAIPPDLPHYWDLTPGVTVTGGDITAAGAAMAWARSLFPGAAMERSQPGARGLAFLPQFAGRIAPDINRDVRGAFHGLDGMQSADDMLRAVGEGIAFSLRQVRDHIAAAGLAATRTIATGGGAHDPLQAQIVAGILQQRVAVSRCEEGCRGAALLGAVAAGHIDLEAARLLEPGYDRFDPEPAHAAAYDAAYRRFLAVQAATDRIEP